MKFKNEQDSQHTQRLPHNHPTPFMAVKAGYGTTSKHFPIEPGLDTGTVATTGRSERCGEDPSFV